MTSASPQKPPGTNLSPRFRKPCPSGNPRRRMNSPARRCQTTRVCRIPNEPVSTNQTQLDLRGNTRGAQHRRETTLHFGAHPLGVAVRRRKSLARTVDRTDQGVDAAGDTQP